MRKKTRWALIWACLGVVLLVVIFRPFRCAQPEESGGEIHEILDTTELVQKHYKYGIPDEELVVVEGKVGKNEHLSTILSRYGVSPAKIHEAAQCCKDIFDVRRIRVGHHYSLFLSGDSLRTPEFFVYESSATEYVVFDFKENCRVYLGQKPITKKEREAVVGITSSLWNAMKEAGADPALAITLSDIYAWSIDFYGIARNDSIRVIYEQTFVEERPLSDFTIKAVCFNHAGKSFYAFPFMQDGRISFFDENGTNLQKAFLKAPLKYSRISSGFSNSRYHPVLKINRPHHGVDYSAPVGTEVMAIGDGVVVKRAYQANGGGNYVTIKHNSVYSTTYMHLSKFGKGIHEGARVKQGDVIGYVGSTGLSTGPHLDFRVYKNGTAINPLKMESPAKEPIAREEMETFAQLRDSLLMRLSLIAAPPADLAADRTSDLVAVPAGSES